MKVRYVLSFPDLMTHLSHSSCSCNNLYRVFFREESCLMYTFTQNCEKQINLHARFKAPLFNLAPGAGPVAPLWPLSPLADT